MVERIKLTIIKLLPKYMKELLQQLEKEGNLRQLKFSRLNVRKKNQMSDKNGSKQRKNILRPANKQFLTTIFNH